MPWSHVLTVEKHELFYTFQKTDRFLVKQRCPLKRSSCKCKTSCNMTAHSTTLLSAPVLWTHHANADSWCSGSTWQPQGRSQLHTGPPHTYSWLCVLHGTPRPYWPADMARLPAIPQARWSTSSQDLTMALHLPVARDHNSVAV